MHLSALDDLGRNRLPGISQSMSTALEKLTEATGWITRTFDTRGASMDTGGFDTSMPYRHYLFWQPGNECYYTLDFVKQVFQDNRDNVDLAAQAIVEIATRYRQADGQA
ncbi:hypothetical protein SAMN05216174_108106 [Actinokineospora iranica]|uniref:Uncharacterized protein n=1 Tax=Actinokineospora iranica TaxID=1271860 RepID=A0A1G6SQ34_9PSEU|nr:hypothetical protein SAMN05216174_108106 [Actinokineospora iranica]